MIDHYRDQSLCRDFRVSSPVIKGSVRKFRSKNICGFCVIHENQDNI